MWKVAHDFQNSKLLHNLESKVFQKKVVLGKPAECRKQELWNEGSRDGENEMK